MVMTTDERSNRTAGGSKSRRRLQWTIGGLLLVIVLMGALLVSVAARPDDAVESGGVGEGPGPDEVPAPAEEPESLAEELSWAPPELEDPEVIQITEDDRGIELEPDRDYELVLPNEPLEVPGGVSIVGGRNVVMIGGEIRIPDDAEDEGGDVRALYLKDQTGTIHIEGVALTGPGLGEGINLDQREGAVVQLQNIRVDTVQGSQEGHHADVIQSWAGPSELRVDRLSGSTNYQGFFLLPQQFGDQPEPELFDLRRIDLTGEDGAGYMLWRDSDSWPVATQDVWVSPPGGEQDREDFLWARDEGEGTWDDVMVGTPPDGSFVPEGVAGVGYESPGYGGEE